jgi:hypothetical protein
MPETTPTFSDAERLQGWQASMLDGGFHAIHWALTTGPFLPAVALLLGATPFELGIVGAITQLAMVGAAGMDRLPIARKPMAMWAAAGSRYLWIVIATLPMLPLAGHGPMTVFLVLYALSSLLLQTAGLAWLDWIGDLVEAKRRGRYFAWRNAMITGLMMLCAAAAGPWLDLNRANGHEAHGFAGMLLVAVLAAVGCRWSIRRQPDHAVFQPTATEGRSAKTPTWRSFLLFIGAWLLVASLAGPFYTAYALQSLHMTYQQIAMWSLIGNLTGMICQPLFGRPLDGGRRTAMMLTSATVIAGLPLLWLIASPDRLWPVWVDGIGNGIVWTAFSLCQTHLVLQVCPMVGRRRQLGLYTAVTGMSGGMSALIGGWLIGRHWALPLNGPPLLFVLTSIGRAVCVLWLMTLIRRWNEAHAETLPAAQAVALPQ